MGLLFDIPGMLACRDFDDLYRKQQNYPCPRDNELLNSTTNEESFLPVENRV